jgi:hypothetical protein
LRKSDLRHAEAVENAAMHDAVPNVNSIAPVRRRDFITLLGGAAAWPLAARAQQRERTRRVGVLNAPAAGDPVAQARAATLTQALGALHWREGDNLIIDWLRGQLPPTLRRFRHRRGTAWAAP